MRARSCSDYKPALLRLRVNAVQSRFGDQELHASCILRLARKCIRLRRAADNIVRERKKMGIF